MDHFNHFSHAWVERLKKLLIVLTLLSVEHPGNKAAYVFFWIHKRSRTSEKCRAEKGVFVRLVFVLAY